MNGSDLAWIHFHFLDLKNHFTHWAYLPGKLFVMDCLLTNFTQPETGVSCELHLFSLV